MKIYKLQKVQYLPITIEAAWEFFSHAKNLAKITPAEMNFVVLTKLNDDPIYSGMKIEYRVRPLFNIPMGWTTEIKKVSAPFRFTDKQIKGPYALWEHTHTFEQVPGGVKMTDEVDYALPFGWLGIFAHALIVKNKLKDIFNFREQTLTKFFGEYKKP